MANENRERVSVQKWSKFITFNFTLSLNRIDLVSYLFIIRLINIEQIECRRQAVLAENTRLHSRTLVTKSSNHLSCTSANRYQFAQPACCCCLPLLLLAHFLGFFFGFFSSKSLASYRGLSRPAFLSLGPMLGEAPRSQVFKLIAAPSSCCYYCSYSFCICCMRANLSFFLFAIIPSSGDPI